MRFSESYITHQGRIGSDASAGVVGNVGFHRSSEGGITGNENRRFMIPIVITLAALDKALPGREYTADRIHDRA